MVPRLRLYRKRCKATTSTRRPGTRATGAPCPWAARTSPCTSSTPTSRRPLSLSIPAQVQSMACLCLQVDYVFVDHPTFLERVNGLTGAGEVGSLHPRTAVLASFKAVKQASAAGISNLCMYTPHVLILQQTRQSILMIKAHMLNPKSTPKK